MQIGIFDEIERLERLSALGDPLTRLNQVINWEMFRPVLQQAFRKERKGPGGRPPYDYVMMFKVLVLQMLYKLSDDQTEYQINDRMSFMRFLGLGLGSRVPDAKTIWLYRETLTKAKVMDKLFSLFNAQLKAAGLITHTGSIVDATFVDAPRQRNTREENAKIKAGEVPEEWKEPENIHKMRQKDTDARWTKKNNETHFGYKDHVKVDSDSKLIVEYSVTSANVHDSQALSGLINEEDQVLYADSAYSGKVLLESLPDHVERRVHEKGTRNHPLTDEQKESNRLKSKIRVRVEHVFGFMTNSMGGIDLRCIGRIRAEFDIGMRNLVYNICRYEFLQRPKPCRG
jgi:IS5 family transposase